jgi:hypothetical protein
LELGKYTKFFKMVGNVPEVRDVLKVIATGSANL